MNTQYDAKVVGGGLVGLTSAAYSSRYGYRTLLLEKGSPSITVADHKFRVLDIYQFQFRFNEEEISKHG